jgi:hypothetical protein
MKRSHWMKAAVAVFVLTATAPPAWTAPVPAEKSPLAWVPADAVVVIHLNGLESLRAHVVAFLKNAVPDRAGMVQEQSEKWLKEGVAGRKLRGLAKNGPIFIEGALFEGYFELRKPGDKPPKAALIAAITSYAEFRDNILSETEKKNLKSSDGYESTVGDWNNENIFFVDKKDHVVVTPSKDVAAAFAKGGPGLDGKMSKAQAAKLLSTDVGVYLSMDVFNKEYADQIKTAHEAADEQLKKLEDTVGKAQKSQFELMKSMIGPIFQAVEDSKGALITLEIRPGGVAWHMQSEVRAGSPTADALKDSKQSAFTNLAKMPAGELFYVGMEISPVMAKSLSSMLTGLTADPDSKGAKAMAEAFNEWSKSAPSEVIEGLRYPLSGVQVQKSADPEKTLAASIKMFKAMGAEGSFQNVYFKEKPTVKEKAEKYKDIDFTSIHMVFDLEKSMAAAGGGKEMPEAAKKQLAEAMKKLIGESLNVWIGSDGKQIIQVFAKDWNAAEKLLDQYFKGVHTAGADKAFAAVRKELPAEAAFLMEMDVVQYTAVILDFIKPIIEASPFGAKFPKAVKGAPGYLGAAVTLTPERGGFDFFVSSDAVKQAYQDYVSLYQDFVSPLDRLSK